MIETDNRDDTQHIELCDKQETLVKTNSGIVAWRNQKRSTHILYAGLNPWTLIQQPQLRTN